MSQPGKKKSKSQDDSFIGTQWNNWTVVGLSYLKHDSGRTSLYKCVCKCGNIGHVRKEALKKGLSKSCGCLPYKVMTKKERIFGRVD